MSNNLGLKVKIKSSTEKIRDQYKINDEIKSLTGKIRLVDPENNMNKEMFLNDALTIADERDLDVVQISGSDVPICKLIQFDKFLYQLEKTKKKNVQHTKKNKFIKFTPNISDHDLTHKIEHIKQFILDGFKVDLVVQFRGRENSHKEFGHTILNKIITELDTVAKVETPIKDNGNNITMMLSKK